MMRALCIVVIVALHALCSAGGPGSGRRCTGKDPCLVCSDCSRCSYCDPNGAERHRSPKATRRDAPEGAGNIPHSGGSCGTCRDQSGDEAGKRDAKRAKN